MKLVSDQRNWPIEGLTHSDDVYVRLVHSNVIFGCPMHTNICPGLENLILLAKCLQFRHKFSNSMIAHDKTGVDSDDIRC